MTILAASIGVLLLRPLLRTPDVAHAFSPSPSSGTTIPTATALGSSSDGLESLQNIPFLPAEVLSEFLTGVGPSLTAANLRVGYHSGVVSREELDDIERLLPEIAASSPRIDDDESDTTDRRLVQSVAEIRGHWDTALRGRSWPVRKLGEWAAPAVVGSVARLQEKTVRQAGAMEWINREGLEVLRGGTDAAVGVRAALSGGSGEGRLRFNDTRARFEEERGVWSASMDVFFETAAGTVAAVEGREETAAPPSPAAAAALSALLTGTDDDDEDLSAAAAGGVAVVDDTGRSTPAYAVAAASPPPPPAVVGSVNAYFVPEGEIKILVVEIEDVSYNVTWKGL